eukprot:4966045-Alexandrium_andersonii.AAC.1
MRTFRDFPSSRGFSSPPLRRKRSNDQPLRKTPSRGNSASSPAKIEPHLPSYTSVSYTHLRAHETSAHL